MCHRLNDSIEFIPFFPPSQPPLKMADDHARCTYNDIHKMIAKSAERIQAEFKPDVIIAIGM
jgi:hypothetical protein